RPWTPIEHDAKGAAICPAPSDKYEPCCFRAGALIRARCGSISKAECDQRVHDAELRYLAAGSAGHLTVPGASVEDWGDCGQCRDCFLP
ncbi:hypothetical protein, partial [Bacillus amyloliquefaciens]|uniref:hypothetical protein n=1 Tax=Bacillus amyloliquefaciens TaxID=1390 RepID=UPI00197A9FBA